MESFVGKERYIKWLKDMHRINSGTYYASRINTIWQDDNIKRIPSPSSIKDKRDKERAKLISKYSSTLSKQKINHLNAIIYYALKGQECYSFTLLDFIEDFIVLANLKGVDKSYMRYFTCFRQFIEWLVFNKDEVKHTWKEKEEEKIHKIAKTQSLFAKKNIHKIDGNEALARMLGVNVFLKMAIEGSYFLNNHMVETRFEELSGYFKNKFMDDKKKNVQIPARKTTREDGQTEGSLSQDKKTFNVNGLSIPVIIDSNGNQQVCSLINKSTGYYHQTGKDNIFQNYIISHIWGHAYDPRYFTNWWNVVLVPAWANGLLDKNNCAEGSLASKFKSTMMAICQILYRKVFNSSDGDWNAMKMSIPRIENQNDIISMDFNINIIENGKISQTQTQVGKINHEVIKKDQLSDIRNQINDRIH